MQAHSRYFERLYRLYEALVALHAGLQQFLQQLLAGQFLHYSLDTMLLVHFHHLSRLTRHHSSQIYLINARHARLAEAYCNAACFWTELFQWMYATGVLKRSAGPCLLGASHTTTGLGHRNGKPAKSVVPKHATQTGQNLYMEPAAVMLLGCAIPAPPPPLPLHTNTHQMPNHGARPSPALARFFDRHQLD